MTTRSGAQAEMFRIAIQPDSQELTSGRLQSFSSPWTEHLRRLGHDVRLVNVYEPGFFASLDGCDGFMWWFAHTSKPRNIGRRILPAVEHGVGIPVFPSWRTIWHFDDKIAQHYLLQAAGIPVPETWVFWSADDALAFAAAARYPLVIKLASGITSENVALVATAADARYWIARLFRHGSVTLHRDRAVPPPRALARRLVDATRLFATGALPPIGSRTDLQKGYVLLQEFLPDNDFDTRVTVIGNRGFAFRRFNRPGDFRASGSGRLDWTPAAIAPDSVGLALGVAHTLGLQSVAVDVLRRGDRPVVGEISYYYEGWAVAACPGHWRRPHGEADGPLEWVEGAVTPESAILADFLQRVAADRGRPAEPA